MCAPINGENKRPTVPSSDSGLKWVSFEPTVEFKFSNFHAANQVVNGKLICTVNGNGNLPRIVPINRELMEDENGIQYSEDMYCYDYWRTQVGVFQVDENGWRRNTASDFQRLYDIEPLHLYYNSNMQSPTDENSLVRERQSEITRSESQVRTFVSLVKKYRPITMPSVRDIFDDCQGADTKYEADVNNDYGVFGWCTIPSKTMVDMQYNEQSIMVPSTYDCHNRIGGSNFLQLDNDPSMVYKTWKDGQVKSNVQDTWCYMYAKRDWTYFMKPVFDVGRNNGIYSNMLDTFGDGNRPSSSDHLNGILFETSTQGRYVDTMFGKMVRTCEFLAEHHHGQNSLATVSQRYVNLVPYSKLLELTQIDGEFNSRYGSAYHTLDAQRFICPEKDWIDDFDKTGTSLLPGEYGNFKYKYNLGQSHAIDDFDEKSVWFYITMVEPLDEQDDVIELEDIMPFVFWWQNRGVDNNGPTVDCYGLQGNAKMNYEQGGWCYSSAQQRLEDIASIDEDGHVKHEDGDVASEQRWHAVQRTLGIDFSQAQTGGVVVGTDNSGNVYKGAFDPNCAGSDEKWKIHHMSNAFGTPQHDDLVEDKYWKGEETHGKQEFDVKATPPSLNDPILESIKDRPMSWNLWNVVRHYVYINWFKNKHKVVGKDEQSWNELEQMTHKLVKGIYRTYKQRQSDNNDKTFSDMDKSYTNSGNNCLVRWTNSFVQIQSILERNAREHDASLVLFTGNNGTPDSDRSKVKVNYETIRNSKSNFVVNTLDGTDSDKTGMRPRKLENGIWVDENGETNNAEFSFHVFQGHVLSELPTTYLVGGNTTYSQNQGDVDIDLGKNLDLDQEYPYSEYYRDDTTRKWVRNIRQVAMGRQMFPVYTSMETMDKDVHDVTVEELKGITFQVIPQLYWRYEWAHNDFMIHRVGRLQSPSQEIEMYDMLGNVWEWVRDDWTEKVSELDN